MGALARYLGLEREEPGTDMLTRETGAVAPTLASLITDWQTEQVSPTYFSPHLIDRLWVATRCIQLNSQQIASMPLRFEGSASALEPAWVSNPDPVWYPNGIADAVQAATASLYGWGDAFLLVTGRYANGFPSAWTVLDPAVVSVDVKRGRRTYKANEGDLNPDDVVQISRDPRAGMLRGTSALRSYGAQAWSLIAAGISEQNVVGAGQIPMIALKLQRKMTREQAEALQQQWVSARQRYGRGVPAVVPPEIDIQEIAINPEDLILLEAQEFDARVIANAFGVPAFLLNLPITGSLVYQNPQSLGEFWWRFELRPVAKRIADALSANMLPRGSVVTFDASDTFAAIVDTDDSQSQAEDATPNDENVRPLRPAQEATP